MPDSLRALHTWEGEGFGVLNDADGQVLYYRKSALTDPAHAAAFKSEYGYDIPVPPRTWQQLRDVAAYFNGKNWDANDDEADSGMVLHLKVGEQGHYHFQSLSASFAVTPGPEVDQHHNVYWFDPTNMKPMINSPGHVRALEFLLDLHKTGPSAQVGWALGEAWDYFLRGKAVFVFSWGDVGSLCQDTARSKIQGDCTSAILPASEEYYDHASGEFVTADDPVPVGNTTGGSWHGVVSAFSANPEATFSFWSLMAMKEVSLWNSQFGWTGVDPGYSYQFLKPLGEATVEEYVAAGWDAEGREVLHPGVPRQLLRRHDPHLPPDPRHLRVLGHPRQESLRDDERRAHPAGGPRPDGRDLGGHHRATRPRGAAQILPGRHRLRRLIRVRIPATGARAAAPVATTAAGAAAPP